MTTLKEWLNEAPGAARMEAEEREKAERPALPFDPRTEVSADAKFIVRQLLTWLLAVPLAIALLIWLATR